MPVTTKTFTDLDIDPALVDRLTDQDITEAFPIQELAIPMALKGADVIGQARTGTGKTLAFGLPLLQRVDPDLGRTQALVVTPTRELCLQVAGDLEIGGALGIDIQTVYGGVGYEEQIAALTSGVPVVVGTPGRLLDHLGRGNLDLSGLTELVLDEADEMLDMGFLPDVEKLIDATPESRHTMLFSATMPSEIVKLARRYMAHPTFLRAEAEQHEVSPTVDQHFFLVHRMDKPRILARILQDPDRGGAYVFTRTKRMADRLVRELGDLNVSAIAVHGDKRQATRERNMDKFRDGHADVLVATEVAARGLDVDNVTHVINYDCPDDEKMYLHRIGRTARAGNEGVAVTFAEFNQVDRLNVIRRAVEADEEVAEIFSTSEELTKRFGLPERTPWEHLRGDGEARDDGSGGSGNGSGGHGGSSDRASSGDGSGRSRARRARSSRSSGTYVSPTERTPAAERTRSRSRNGSGQQKKRKKQQKQKQTNKSKQKAGAGSSRKRSRASTGPKATRSRSRDGTGPGGSGATPPGSNGSERTAGPQRSRHERTVTEPVVRTDQGPGARGEGTPRLSRRMTIDHLP